jgi:plastocyanin
MSKLLTAVVVLIVILGGAWALFGRSNNSNTSSYGATSPNTSNTNTQSSNSTPETTNTVSIEGFAFNPGNITVKKGTTVTWTNNDSIAHTVTESDDKNGPDSDTLQPGKTYEFTYAQTGTFQYKCTLHPDMTGTVTVTQ